MKSSWNEQFRRVERRPLWRLICCVGLVVAKTWGYVRVDRGSTRAQDRAFRLMRLRLKSNRTARNLDCKGGARQQWRNGRVLECVIGGFWSPCPE